MNMNRGEIFTETYRVLAVEDAVLVLQGVQSGDVLTINNAYPEVPLSKDDYPIGQLITLTDPGTNPPN